MKKLTLESLEVTSFDTSPDARPLERGSVQGHARTQNCPPATYNVDACGDTQYFDCTLGCSINTNCPNGCIVM